MKKFLRAAASVVALLAAHPALATVTNSVVTVTDTATGSSNVYNYSFLIPYQSDGITPAVTVQTVVAGAVSTLDPSTYDITGVGSASGGTVTIHGANLAAGSQVIITRSYDYTQTTAVANTGFYPHTVEVVADNLEYQIQQLANQYNAGQVNSFNTRVGSVTLQASDVTGVLPTIAYKDANNTFTGNNTFNAQTLAGMFQPRGDISPMDYPYLCWGDGVHDDTACFQQALTASLGKRLVLGAHRYLITSNLTMPSGPVAVAGLGTGWNSVFSGQNYTSCLVAGAPNLTFFTVASGDQLSGFCVLAGGWSAISGTVQGYITAGSSQLNVTAVGNVPFTSPNVPITIPTTGSPVVSSATTGLPAGLTITSQASGTPGGVGVYNLSASVASGFGSAGSPANFSVSLANTSGNYAIKYQSGTAGSYVHGLWVDHACSGIDFNGQVNWIDTVLVQNFFGTGCIGLTHGRLTTNATSNDNWLSDILTVSDRTNPGDAGFAFYDAGGSLISRLDTIYAKVGTLIKPGGGQTAANQIVQFVNFTGSTLADTDLNGGIQIDTVGSTNMVKGLMFNGDWSSSATTGDEVSINNTGGGSVSDITFVAHRIYGVTAGNGITIGSGVTNVTVTGGTQICGYNSGYGGIDLKSGATNVDVTSVHISPTCAKKSGTGSVAIAFEGSNDFVTVMANDLYGNGGQTIFSGLGLNGATHTQISNNLPIDNNLATLTSTAISGGVLDFTQGGTVGNFYPGFFINANGATITGFSNLGWSGRTIRLQAVGGTSFTIGGGTNAAGSIASPAITVNAFQWVICYYGGTYLTCH